MHHVYVWASQWLKIIPKYQEMHSIGPHRSLTARREERMGKDYMFLGFNIKVCHETGKYKIWKAVLGGDSKRDSAHKCISTMYALSRIYFFWFLAY